MEAIVLAGGLGTRLRGIVDDVPKPMAPVQGRPFLSFVLDQLVATGFHTAILAVGYRHEAIRAHFGDAYRSLTLLYSLEEEPLGTGGAIRLACAQVTTRDVFVLNGDTFLDLDFHAMLNAHVRAAAQLSLAVCKVPDVARYGAVEMGDVIVRGFHEKGTSGRGWINGGVYLLGPDLRRRFPRRAMYSFEQDLLVPETQAIRPLAFPTTGLFLDIGIPEDYARAQQVSFSRSTR